MTQVDHIFAISMTLIVVSFLIFYVASDFEVRSTDMKISQIRHSASLLTNQIGSEFEEDIDKFTVMFTEIGGMSHSESLQLSINSFEIMPEPDEPFTELEGVAVFETKTRAALESDGQKLYIYDSEGNPVSATYVGGTITLPFSFSPHEKKLLEFYYTGSVSSVSYDSPENIVNVSAVIVSGQKEKYIPSTNLIADYETLRDSFDFNDMFKIIIGDSIIGPEPPRDANVVVEHKSFLIENNNELVNIIAEVNVW